MNKALKTGIAALCAVKAGYDDYVRTLLLNAFLSDGLKISVLNALCSRNEDNQFGVVICNIYKCVDVYSLRLGRSKRKCFIEAYSVLVSRFGILDEGYPAKFCGAAERLYAAMAKAGTLALGTDLKALAAALPHLSDHGLVYLESDREIAEEDLLAAGAQSVRAGRAGAVFYRLVERRSPQES